MLSAAVDRYLAARRAVGFKLRDTEEILRDFVAFASAKADQHVCSRTVLEWIRSRNRSPLRNEIRLQMVARLARYLHAEDERHEIPPKTFCHHSPRRRPPFLFTPAHVAALVRRAFPSTPHLQHALRPAGLHRVADLRSAQPADRGPDLRWPVDPKYKVWKEPVASPSCDDKRAAR